MGASVLAFAAILVVCLTATYADAAVQADAQPAGKCIKVECLVNPCDTTTCKPTNPVWQCVPNYCSGCNTQWRHSGTGLLISTCPPDVCPFIVDPVCGTDGNTYPNYCIALTNGVKVAYKGACKCSSTCLPVCGADGITYHNRCLALQNGTTVAYAGTCLFPTKCAKDNLKYNPVCEPTTLLTWTNPCVADLNSIQDYTTGPCIGPMCASCILNGGCSAAHPCKGNPKYICEQSACRVNHILDNGTRVTYSVCSPVYKDKASGYPAAACFP